MEKLISYFKQGRPAEAGRRTVGVEIETLFVDANLKPISLVAAQSIWRRLVDDWGWTIVEQKAGMLVELEKQGFRLIYELSWNNFELTTPPALTSNYSDLFRSIGLRMAELALAAESFGVKPLIKRWDSSRDNTLILPDRRDEIWVKLDGLEPLCLLGHTSCIHFNLDLQSIEEGLRFMAVLKIKYLELGWPALSNGWAWREYLETSRAGYESDRYGWPPAGSLLDYCRKLSSFKVVMDKTGDDLAIVDPALEFSQVANPDINLFLRSVWWIFRLRVRGGKLVLEIRDVPRTIPLSEAWGIIKDAIGV
jgi:hypothetical protein